MEEPPSSSTYLPAAVWQSQQGQSVVYSSPSVSTLGALTGFWCRPAQRWSPGGSGQAWSGVASSAAQWETCHLFSFFFVKRQLYFKRMNEDKALKGNQTKEAAREWFESIGTGQMFSCSCGCSVNNYEKEVVVVVVAVCLLLFWKCSCSINIYTMKCSFFLFDVALLYQYLHKWSAFSLWSGVVPSIFTQMKCFFTLKWSCSINIYTNEVLFLLWSGVVLSMFIQMKYFFVVALKWSCLINVYTKHSSINIYTNEVLFCFEVELFYQYLHQWSTFLLWSETMLVCSSPRKEQKKVSSCCIWHVCHTWRS